jgi:hypothetical protein
VDGRVTPGHKQGRNPNKAAKLSISETLGITGAVIPVDGGLRRYAF